jgi:hypothetical protein
MLWFVSPLQPSLQASLTPLLRLLLVGGWWGALACMVVLLLVRG